MSQLILDAPGWILMFASFALPVFFIRRNEPLLLAVLFTVALHDAASLIHCYVYLLPGCDADAQTFFFIASDLPGTTILGQPPYVYALRFVYEALGPSKLLGCQLSVLAFTASVLVFIQLIRWLGAQRHAVPLVVLYGALPSVVFLCSVTLREAYQLLVICAILWLTARIGEGVGKPLDYLGVLVCVVALTFLHNGLAILALGLACIAVIWALRVNAGLTTFLALGVVVLLVLFQGPFVEFMSERSFAFRAVAEGNLLNVMETYREKVNVGRSTYGGSLRTDSLGSFLTTFPKVFCYYMFSPLPWQASGLSDLYALLESWLRMMLCVGIGLNLSRSEPHKRKRVVLLAATFFFIECFWAVGSSNWGQAIRHRVVAYGLLVLAGAEPYLDLLFPRAVEPDDAD